MAALVYAEERLLGCEQGLARVLGRLRGWAAGALQSRKEGEMVLWYLPTPVVTGPSNVRPRLAAQSRMAWARNPLDTDYSGGYSHFGDHSHGG